MSRVRLLATAAGCGARVDLESANWASSSGETARTAVEVDLLRTRVSEPVAQATEPPPKPVASEEKLVIGSGNTFVFNYRAGDVTYHNETHIHIHIHVHEPLLPKVEERIVVQREVQIERPRPVDERCRRLAREHEQRVETWRQFPFGR